MLQASFDELTLHSSLHENVHRMQAHRTRIYAHSDRILHPAIGWVVVVMVNQDTGWHHYCQNHSEDIKGVHRYIRVVMPRNWPFGKFDASNADICHAATASLAIGAIPAGHIFDGTLRD